VSGIDMNLVDVGLYSVPEARRLTGISTQRIRRWLFGYSYRGRDKVEHEMHPICVGDAPSVDETVGLSFLDLMEVRMVDAFCSHRVSWKAIREAADAACELYDDRHPFMMKRFMTDGNRIFAEIRGTRKAKDKLYDLNRKHYVFKPVVEKSLFAGIEFENDQAVRWFPEHLRRQVVLDPRRSFGRPIVTRGGVPTEILAKSAEVEGSAELTARWYDIPVAAVRAAVEFEQRLSA